MEAIIATWCSFCCSEEAGGELMVEGDALPVCDTCMENYDEKVAPLIRELVSDEA